MGFMTKYFAILSVLLYNLHITRNSGLGIIVLSFYSYSFINSLRI